MKLDSQLLRQGRFASSPGLDAWLATKPWARQIEHLLEQADSRLTVLHFCGFALLGATVGILLGPLAGAPAGILLTGVGLALPYLVLVRIRERRSKLITKQLPEALDMMARSLRAGHALSSAFELVSTEMPEPVSVEFSRAFEEQRLGMPLERVVLEMAARSPRNGDLKLFAVSAVIQRETGGNLAEILNGISHTIRERYRFFGKLRALTAEARASAWFVSALPLLLFLFFATTQREYVAPLFTTPSGKLVLGAGIAAWVTGVLWFSKLTRFRYYAMTLDLTALFITSGFVVALFAVGAMIFSAVATERGAVRRLQRRLAPSPDLPDLVRREQVARFVAKGLSPLARLAALSTANATTELGQKLTQAGYRSPYAVQLFLGSKVALAVLGAGLFLWVDALRAQPIHMGPAWAVVMAAFGLFLPNGWLNSAVRKRQQAIEEGLPDMLDLLVTCVEAGLGLDMAVQRVAREMTIAQPILSEELTLTFLEVKAGLAARRRSVACPSAPGAGGEDARRHPQPGRDVRHQHRHRLARPGGGAPDAPHAERGGAGGGPLREAHLPARPLLLARLHGGHPRPAMIA